MLLKLFRDLLIIYGLFLYAATILNFSKRSLPHVSRKIGFWALITFCLYYVTKHPKSDLAVLLGVFSKLFGDCPGSQEKYRFSGW